MTIIDRHLSLQKRQFGRGHVLVMALAAAGGLIATTAPFATTPADTPSRAPAAASTASTYTAPSPLIIRTLGYVEFEWPHADSAIPGFGLLATGDAATQ